MSEGINVRRRAIAIGLWSAALAVVSVTGILKFSGALGGRTYDYGFGAATIGVAFTTLGVVILRRHPEHRVGRLLVALGCAGAVQLATGQFAFFVTDDVVAGSLIVTSEAVRMLGLGAAGILFLIYPTGHLPGRRWRWAAWACGFMVFQAAAYIVRPGAVEDFAPLQGPFQAPTLAPVADLLATISVPALPGILAAVLSLVFRYRGARSSERQQIKLFAFTAAVCTVVILTATIALPVQTERWLGHLVWNAPLVLLPAAAAIAIYRYHLFDIDRLISRTVSYAIVTAILGALFAFVALAPTAVVGTGADIPDWAIVAATVLIGTAFRPLRRRVQTGVDRRFNRDRYDVGRTIDEFSARLREEIDIDTLAAELQGVVARTMQPTHVNLWIRPG